MRVREVRAEQVVGVDLAAVRLARGIRWKPKPHGAKRTKSSSHSDPLVFFFTRADRPQ